MNDTFRDIFLYHITEFDIYIFNENHDIAIAMSSSHADPVLGLNILHHWLGVFKYLKSESLPWLEAFQCLIQK